MSVVAKKLLFASDFSSCSEEALFHALAWAKTLHAGIDIVYVLEMHHGLDVEGAVFKLYMDEQQKVATTEIDKLVKRVRSFSVAPVTPHVVWGHPADQVAQVALDTGADLIFMGTHGWTGFDRVLLGSTAERVISLAPCPVVAVRIHSGPVGTAEAESPPAPSQSTADDLPSLPQHILVPVDFSDCSLEAVEMALQVAQTFRSAVTLLHVSEPIGYSLDFRLSHIEQDKQARENAKARVEELAQLIRSQGLTAHVVFKNPPVSDAIVDVSSQGKVDLIVMGTHGRRGVSRVFLGSVAAAVLRHAACPVLTVKSPRYAVGHPRRMKPSQAAVSPGTS